MCAKSCSSRPRRTHSRRLSVSPRPPRPCCEQQDTAGPALGLGPSLRCCAPTASGGRADARRARRGLTSTTRLVPPHARSLHHDGAGDQRRRHTVQPAGGGRSVRAHRPDGAGRQGGTARPGGRAACWPAAAAWQQRAELHMFLCGIVLCGPTHKWARLAPAGRPSWVQNAGMALPRM